MPPENDKLFHIKLAKVGGIKYDYIFTVIKAIMHLVELASSISGHMMIWELIRFCNVNVVSSLTHSLIPATATSLSKSTWRIIICIQKWNT